MTSQRFIDVCVAGALQTHTVHHAQGFLVTADISLGLFSGHAEALDLIY